MSLVEIDTRMNKNEVVNYLKKRGYNYYIFENGYFSKPKDKNDTYITVGLENGFLQNRLSPDNDFLLFFLNNSIFSPILNKFKFIAVSIYRQRIYNIFNKFNSIAKKSEKKFVFAHILSPHPPISSLRISGRRGLWSPLTWRVTQRALAPHTSRILPGRTSLTRMPAPNANAVRIAVRPTIPISRSLR